MNVGDLNKSALSYLGVSASNPANMTIRTYAPTVKDYKEFRTGDYWLKADPDGTNAVLHILASKWQGEGIWAIIGGGGSGILDTITIDGGNIISPVAANINLLGGDNINLTTPGAATINVNLNTWIEWPATGVNAGYIEIDSSIFMHAFGTNNTFLGSNSGNLTLTSSVSNVGIGSNSLQSLVTGDHNVCVGVNSGMSFTTATGNVAIGSGALSSLGASTSESNTAVGRQAGEALVSGSGGNTFIGRRAGLLATTGGFNLFLGYNSGFQLTTGEHNILIGPSAGGSYITSESDNIIIGTANSVVGDNNTIRIGAEGNGSFQQDKCYIAGIANSTSISNAKNVVIDSATGQLGVGGSDGTPNAFFAYLATDSAGTIDGVTYTLGSADVLTELYDDGGNFFVGDGAGTPASFMAPADGKYWFMMQGSYKITAAGSPLINAVSGKFTFISTARNYLSMFNTKFLASGTGVWDGDQYGVLVDMTAGDTITFDYFIVAAGTGRQTVMRGGPATDPMTWVCGWQVSS